LTAKVSQSVNLQLPANPTDREDQGAEDDHDSPIPLLDLIHHLSLLNKVDELSGFDKSQEAL
jgi:hypothetical protein